MKLKILFVSALLVISSTAYTQDASTKTKAGESAKPDVSGEQKSGVKPSGSVIDQWGLGLGLAVEGYKTEYIKSAAIHGTDKIVVVNESFSQDAAIWAVGNWTVDRCEANAFLDLVCSDWVKPGIFFGAKLAGQDGAALEGISIGVQWSFLQNATKSDIERAGQNTSNNYKKPSWNLGIGIVAHDVQTFANGIVEGEALPSHFQQIEYRKKSETSFIIMISKNIM